MIELYEKSVSSQRGTTYYWTNEIESVVSLVFLPGLTADHRLFEPQFLFFNESYGLDLPWHGQSHTRTLNSSLKNKNWGSNRR